MLNIVKEGLLYFDVIAATDICCLKEVSDSFLPRALWKKIMETLQILILTIIVTFIILCIILIKSSQAKVFLCTMMPYL